MFLSINRNKVVATLALGSLLILGSCEHSNKSTTEKEDITTALRLDSIQRTAFMDKSKIIANQVNTTLVTALTNAIGVLGFEGSVDFCSRNALTITDSISQSQQVDIRRISHKARNQNNQASELEKYIIDQYALDQEIKKTPLVLSGADGYTFYAPIYIATPLCLNCHGNTNTDISQSVFERISKNYPEDMATGFELNEIRGLLRIREN